MRSGWPPAGDGNDPGYSDSRYDRSASGDAGAGGNRPWDYSQPLQYDDEDPVYRLRDDSGYSGSGYSDNGYSRPGIDGPGYDLSGIISTSDFPEFGYDEPRHGRLSYDDPRYPALDETRLDGFALPGFGRGREAERETGGAGRFRSGEYSDPSPSPAGSPRAGQLNETRLDLGFRAQQVRDATDRGATDRGATDRGATDRGTTGPRAVGPRAVDADSTQSDMPAYREPATDETRTDMVALGEDRRSATGVLARPDVQEPGWAEMTSLDSFVGPNLDNAQDLLAKITGPQAASQRVMRRVEVGTGSPRTAGRRRGRSSDRRQWLALGAIVVVAAGAITGALVKFVFSGPSGPAHTISTPAQLDGFTRAPSLEKAMNVDALREQVIKTSSGQASDVLPAVYQHDSSAPGGNAKIFMFVGGHLANSSPAASIASFKQSYAGAKVVPAGALGGEAACTEAVANNESVSMCVWFDNNTFGTLVSPSMTTTALARTMLTVRPGFEQVSQ